MSQKRRFEVLLPLRYPDGATVPVELLVKTQRDVQYEFGPCPVEQEILQGYDRDTGASREFYLRLFVHARDTPENLAYFYKLKQELQLTFRHTEIHICSLPVTVV